MKHGRGLKAKLKWICYGKHLLSEAQLGRILKALDNENITRCKNCDCAEQYGLKQYCLLYGVIKDDNGFCNCGVPKQIGEEE